MSSSLCHCVRSYQKMRVRVLEYVQTSYLSNYCEVGETLEHHLILLLCYNNIVKAR